MLRAGVEYPRLLVTKLKGTVITGCDSPIRAMRSHFQGSIASGLSHHVSTPLPTYRSAGDKTWQSPKKPGPEYQS